MGAFDLETTGVDIETARIVTSAVSAVGPGLEPDHHTWEVNPGVAIPAGAAAVHGIDDGIAKDFTPAAQAVPDIIDTLERLLTDGSPLVVFNAKYDLSLLDREARRYGVKPLQERLELFVIDPLIIDRAIDTYRPGKRTLEAVSYFYGVGQTEAHSSSDDALVTARVAWRMAEKYPQLEDSNVNLMQSQTVWAAEYADSLQKYFDKTGRTDAVQREWPLVLPGQGVES